MGQDDTHNRFHGRHAELIDEHLANIEFFNISLLSTMQIAFFIRKALLISRSLYGDDTKTLKHFWPLYNKDKHSLTKDLKTERHTNYT